MNGSSGVVLRKLRFCATGVVLTAILMVAIFATPAWAQTLTVNKFEVAGDETVTVGEDLNYVINVTAGAANDALDVQLTDTLPANTTFVSAQITAGGDAGDDCNDPAPGTMGATVTCDLGTIDNTTETVTIVVRPTAAAGIAQSVTNTATADGSNTASDSDTESTQVQPLAIIVQKDDQPDAVDVGETLIYTITVDNNTSEENLNLDLVDDLPNSVDFLALASDPANACQESAGVVTCEIEDLDHADPPFVVQIGVEPQQAGTIQNTPQVFCDSPEDAGCPSEDPDTFTPIAQTTESTVVTDNGNDDGDDGDDGTDDGDDGTDDGDDGGDNDNNRRNRGNNRNNDGNNNNGSNQYDQYDDEDDDLIFEDDFDDEEDGDDEEGIVEEDQYADEGLDEDAEDGVIAEADSGADPDELAPVDEPVGEVVDDIPYREPLPPTGGIPLSYVASVAALLTFLGLLVRRR